MALLLDVICELPHIWISDHQVLSVIGVLWSRWAVKLIYSFYMPSFGWVEFRTEGFYLFAFLAARVGLWFSNVFGSKRREELAEVHAGKQLGAVCTLCKHFRSSLCLEIYPLICNFLLSVYSQKKSIAPVSLGLRKTIFAPESWHSAVIRLVQ